MEIKRLFFLAVCILSFPFAKAQDFFTLISERSIKTESRKRTVIPEKFLTYQLNTKDIERYFSSIPELNDRDSKKNAPIIILPLPDGTKAKFKIWKSSVMNTKLAEKFPQILTFTGQGIDDVYATLKLDFTEFGFHAQIKSLVAGDVYIDPYSKNNIADYIVYRKSDLVDNKLKICDIRGDKVESKKRQRIS